MLARKPRKKHHPAHRPRPIKTLYIWCISWLTAMVIQILRTTCRIRMHDDPRSGLRAAGKTYIYAFLHAHQIATIIDCERGTGAMVSRSVDGQLIVPSLRLRGVTPIRGSSQRHGKDKGGRTALAAMTEHLRAGHPASIAVDGPRGPRGEVHKGVAHLASQTGATVVTVVPIPNRRWIMQRTWDRLQIPKPFCRIDAYFGPPLTIGEGEKLGPFCDRIGEVLRNLEQRHDPREAEA